MGAPEYMSFMESLVTTVIGMSIVFLALIFLAVFVMVVSKVVSTLEAKLGRGAPSGAILTETKPVPKSEAVKVAVIAAAISEERKEPLDSFVITKIQKI